jgi:hypothetical protein
LKTYRRDMKLVLLEGVSHTGKTGIRRQPELVTEIRVHRSAGHRRLLNRGMDGCTPGASASSR